MRFFSFSDALKNDRRFILGLCAIFILLAGGCILGWLLSSQLVSNINTPPFMPFRLHLIGLLLASTAFLCFTAWLRQKYHWTVPEEMIDRLHEITEIDAKALSNVMNELSQGNLSTSIQIQASRLEPGSTGGSTLYLEILNHIIEGLHASARELNILTDIPCRRLCYVGADSYLEGRKCGETMGNLLEGYGDVIIITGLFDAIHLELRKKGFENSIRNQFPRIHIVSVSEDHENDDAAYRIAVDAIEKYPHLRGIYINQGATPHSYAQAVQDKKKENQIKIVAHDLTDSTMSYLTKGLISSTLGQDPYAQGYNPVILLFNYLVGKWKPFAHRQLTKMDVVTQENFQMFWHPEQGVIQSSESLNDLVKPADVVSQKLLRIAVMCSENSAFWIPVKKGVMDAAKELSSHHVTVDWFESAPNNDIEESVQYCSNLQSIVNKKYDGIATTAPHRTMIPIINEAVAKGIPVITFNGEPTSLQGLVRAISEQATKLMAFSEALAHSTEEADNLTRQIDNAMNQISDGTIQQDNQVANSQNILQTLLRHIDQVNHAADEGKKTAAVTAHAVTDGAQSMEKTLKIIKNIENSVTQTWKHVEKLGERSEQIDTVIELIQDITSRVNVLAMNASIEATQAGGEGQGFMVVANQVRRLAQNAGVTTQEITALMSRVKQDIKEIEEVMSSGLKNVQQSAQQTDAAQQALKEIRSLIEMDQSRLKSIADAVAEIQTYSYRVEQAMTTVSEVSDKNTKSARDVNMSTKEMVSKLQQVNQLTATLEMMAQSELELLGKFNICVEPGSQKQGVETAA